MRGLKVSREGRGQRKEDSMVKNGEREMDGR